LITKYLYLTSGIYRVSRTRWGISTTFSVCIHAK